MLFIQQTYAHIYLNIYTYNNMMINIYTIYVSILVYDESVNYGFNYNRLDII